MKHKLLIPSAVVVLSEGVSRASFDTRGSVRAQEMPVSEKVADQVHDQGYPLGIRLIDLLAFIHAYRRAAHEAYGVGAFVRKVWGEQDALSATPFSWEARPQPMNHSAPRHIKTSG
jgi:hypothetical protein